MTLEEKLNQTVLTKTAIKNAIVSKGVEVSESTPFSEYPNKIMAINSSCSNDSVNNRPRSFSITLQQSPVDNNSGTPWANSSGPFVQVGKKWKLATAIHSSNVIVTGVYTDDYLYIEGIATKVRYNSTNTNKFANQLLIELEGDEVSDIAADWQTSAIAFCEVCTGPSGNPNERIHTVCECMLLEVNVTDPSGHTKKCVGIRVRFPENTNYPYLRFNIRICGVCTGKKNIQTTPDV